MMESVLEKLSRKENLNASEIEAVMKMIMSGEATQEDIRHFLLDLRDKGPTVEEITGAARIMREFVIPVRSRHEKVLDTCGTGGDRKDTFNISTVSALVVAGAGGVVAKHGNRSVSSRCGSACVLEALGVNLDLSSDQLEQCLERNSIVFLFAQRLHPAMKNVAPVRRELKVETIFNILGPLTNPAGATHQIVGVYNRDLVEPVAYVLKNLGLQKALVVHGSDGLDEITTTGKTFIAEFNGADVITYDIVPEEIGFGQADDRDITGGSVEQNAAIIRAILNGEKGPKRDIVVLNAAYALYTLGIASSINEAVSVACASIDSGAARRKLEDLVAFTQGLGI